MGVLLDSFRILQSGTLWSSAGRCKGFAPSNPTEAAKIEAYVVALDAGERPLPPVLSTATGRGIVGMLAELAGGLIPVPPPPEPPPPTPPTTTLGGKVNAFFAAPWTGAHLPAGGGQVTASTASEIEDGARDGGTVEVDADIDGGVDLG